MTRPHVPLRKLAYMSAVVGLVLGMSARAHALSVAHWHGANPTTWESDGDRGLFETHKHTDVKTEAGDSPHQHYNALSFGGWDNWGDPWSAFGVWADERFYADNTDPFDAQYPPVPHGFINEYSGNALDDMTTAGTSDHIPDYFFENPDQWNDDAMDMVVAAFGAWSALQAGTSPVSGLPLITGLEFEPTVVRENAEIILRWQDIDPLGLTEWKNWGWNGTRDLTVTFDSNPSSPWHYGEDPTNCPPGEYHFYSIGLHEIGHVVGLYHQTDLDDVMIWQFGTGPNGPAFGAIDQDSREGAYALYSIPVPEPVTVLGVFLGVSGVGAYIRRRVKAAA